METVIGVGMVIVFFLIPVWLVVWEIGWGQKRRHPERPLIRFRLCTLLFAVGAIGLIIAFGTTLELPYAAGATFFCFVVLPLAVLIARDLFGAKRVAGRFRRPTNTHDFQVDLDAAGTKSSGVAKKFVSRLPSQFRLVALFYAMTGIALLVVVWNTLPFPTAAVISFFFLVSVPLVAIGITDWKQSETASSRLQSDKCKFSGVESVDQEEQDSLASQEDKKGKWWARKWPRMRLSRYGPWH